MPENSAELTIACPNCRKPMQGHDFEQNYHGAVRVDLCFDCAGIWFDHLGSAKLSPNSVIELFKQIHPRLEGTRAPIANRLACPRCDGALALSFDLCKGGRFSYFRCLHGDGRYTPFFQFLREKQFIRTLSHSEIEHVRAQVRQILCSSCGAPIDLEHDSECRYCRAPVSYLDTEAVEHALHMWSDAAHQRRAGITAAAVGDTMTQIQLTPAGDPASMVAQLARRLTEQPNSGLDLVALGIQTIARLLF
jgi:Transcription factor zinc-finger